MSRHQSIGLYPGLAATVRQAETGIGQIAVERRAELARIARFIEAQRLGGEPARLVFICTHNSRRSHLAQVWAATAAWIGGLDWVETYSGGTEATAVAPQAVAALQRAGFVAETVVTADNPVYELCCADQAPAQRCFSKVFHEPPNPRIGFCAVMTCSDADQACPVVLGAAQRIALPYDDPKLADGTPQEQQVYDSRCRQIAREMLCLLQMVGT